MTGTRWSSRRLLGCLSDNLRTKKRHAKLSQKRPKNHLLHSSHYCQVCLISPDIYIPWLSIIWIPRLGIVLQWRQSSRWYSKPGSWCVVVSLEKCVRNRYRTCRLLHTRWIRYHISQTGARMHYFSTDVINILFVCVILLVKLKVISIEVYFSSYT